MTVERALLVFAGVAITVAIAGLIAFGRAWIAGYRAMRSAEASARLGDTDDIF